MNQLDNERQRYLLAMMRGTMSPDYAQMPPYAMQNTADKQAVQMNSGNRMSPNPMLGMEKAYADGSQKPPQSLAPAGAETPNMYGLSDAQKSALGADFTADENRIASQRDYADMLRGQKMSEGRTVGPYDVYHAPNWGDAVGYAGAQALGGYMTGRANRAEEEVGERRALQKSAAQAKQDFIYNEGRADRAEDRQDRLDQQNVVNERTAERNAVLDKRYLDQETTRVAERKEDYRRELDAADLTYERELEIMKEEALLDERMAELEAELEGASRTVQGEWDEATLAAIDAIDGVGAQKTARMLLDTHRKLSEAISNQEQAILQKDDWNSPAAGFGSQVGEYFGGQTGRNLAKNIAYNDQEEMIRTQNSRAVEAFRRAETGANLTGVEIVVGEDWDLTAPGIGAESSHERSKQLRDNIENTMKLYGLPEQTYKPFRNIYEVDEVEGVGTDGLSEQEIEDGWIISNGVKVREKRG